jgi:anti-sigma factor RsiW
VIGMKCEDVRKLLPEYHDESLLPEQAEEVQRHLSGCEDCRAKLEEIRQTLGLLTQDKVPEREESFWVDFLPQVRSRIEEKQKTRWLAWPKVRWAVGLVSVLALVVVGSLVFTGKDQKLVQQEREQALETSIALSNPNTYADQLAEVLSTAGTESTSVAALLTDSQNQDLTLAEQVLDEDYLGESDLGGLLSELSLEELKQLEQNISNIQVKDIL